MSERIQIIKNRYEICMEGYELNLVPEKILCNAGCVYCTLSKTDLEGITEESNLIDVDELSGKLSELEQKRVYVGSNGDFFLQDTDISYDVLETLLEEGFPIMMITKGRISDEIISLLAKHAKNNPESVVPQISLPSLNEERTKLVEPGSASVEDRLSNVKRLVDVGLEYTTLISIPFFPGIDDNYQDLKELVSKGAELGVKYFKFAYVVMPEEKFDSLRKNDQLDKSLRLMTEDTRILIGKGKTADYKHRVETFENLKKIFNQFPNLKWGVCGPVLDPKMQGNEQGIPICDNFKEFYGF
ncbi:radical SAM protein [Candidatus Woesearchaeota archaeon]|nr:radical SAM protein [Candidatus Woesearchaeota archaeon]